MLCPCCGNELDKDMRCRLSLLPFGQMDDEVRSTANLRDLQFAAVGFVSERNWRNYNSSRTIAMSVAIEAAELMEHYQFEGQESNPEEEMADVLIYLLQLAERERVNLTEAVVRKTRKNREKYPVAEWKNRPPFSLEVRDFSALRATGVPTPDSP